MAGCSGIDSDRLILIGWLGYARFHKPLIQPATQLDFFFFDVGVTFTSWDACQRIHPYAEGHENSESGYQIRYLQSECDYFVAQAMHFEHFCDAVRPVSIGMKDGSEFTARFCKRQIYAPEGKGFQIEGQASIPKETRWPWGEPSESPRDCQDSG